MKAYLIRLTNYYCGRNDSNTDDVFITSSLQNLQPIFEKLGWWTYLKDDFTIEQIKSMTDLGYKNSWGGYGLEITIYPYHSPIRNDIFKQIKS